MALIWMDGFDHYGAGSSGRDNMLAGVWAQISGSGITGSLPTNALSRTGTASLACLGGNVATGNALPAARRVLGGNKNGVGIGMALYMPALPISTGITVLTRFLDSSNIIHVQVMVDTTGTIVVQRRSGAGSFETLYTTDVPVVVAEAWQHYEAYCYVDSTAGAIEIRINGVTVVDIGAVNTVGTGTVSPTIAQVSFNRDTGGDFYIDDVFAWDITGDRNNDFIGDKRVGLIFPDDDTVEADYTAVGAATGYECIDESVPDDATTYISMAPTDMVGSPPVAVGTFSLQNAPAEAISIIAVQTYVRMRKTDAGDCTVVSSIVNNGDVSAGTEKAITEEWTYWMDVHENDPDTGAPWTPAGFNTSQLRITRVT